MFKSMRADAPGGVWAVREPVLFRSVLHESETGVELTMLLMPTPFHTAWTQSDTLSVRLLPHCGILSLERSRRLSL